LALFVWLISHQPAVLFSQNKPATNNRPAVLFSQNKSAPAISHQPNEQAEPGLVLCNLGFGRLVKLGRDLLFATFLNEVQVALKPRKNNDTYGNLIR
jgi:hypothetical protein